MAALKDNIQSFVSYMRHTQSVEKTEINDNIKKVQEMIDMQSGSNYLSTACDVYENRIKDA